MTEPTASALSAVESQQVARELRERLPKEAADISIHNIAGRRTRHESWEKRFGEVVRGWRLDRNWSQEDVVERLRQQGFEMHQTTVAKIERGSRPLRVAEAIAIAEVFGMPIMAVFELSLPDDQPAELAERQRKLSRARRAADESRDTLYASAERHAYLLAEVEKLVLALNDETVREEGDSSDAKA